MNNAKRDLIFGFNNDITMKIISFFKAFKIIINKDNKVINYLKYAIGEIFLITVGILLAVIINQFVMKKENSKSRCVYLNELLFAIERDINDVKNNINAYKKWNPKILSIIKGIESNKLTEIDSLYDKFGTIGNYIYFGQRSRSKIEEIKYSKIDLIVDRELKNNILLYHDDKIPLLRQQEMRYNFIEEDLRKYYSKHFIGFRYEEAYPNNLNSLIKDREYLALVKQRYRMNRWLLDYYEKLINYQLDIQESIKKNIKLNCDEK